MARKSARTLWAQKLAGGAGGKAAPDPVSPGLRPPVRGLVLGIDPSLRGTGLAVIEFTAERTFILRHSETVKIHTRHALPECLGMIARRVQSVLDSFTVFAVAVEETIYVQNFRTAQILGTARGAAIGAAAMRGIPVYEYSPLRVKQAVAGYGRASKEQIAGQIKGLLLLKDAISFDESDAAAVALCHGMTVKN